MENKMDLQMVEFLHNNGSMPDWIYYQVNGKSAEENYREQHEKMIQKFYADQAAKEQQAAMEKKVAEMVEKCLEEALENLDLGKMGKIEIKL